MTRGVKRNESRSRYECAHFERDRHWYPHEIVVSGYNGNYQIVASVATLTEFRETLLKYPDKFHMDEDEIQEEIETVRYFAEFVTPEHDFTVVADDPDDDKFLEAAVAGHVDYIVSGDAHLLDLDTFRGIDIVKPAIFAEQLGIR